MHRDFDKEIKHISVKKWALLLVELFDCGIYGMKLI
jgi:hypothetical protein